MRIPRSTLATRLAPVVVLYFAASHPAALRAAEFIRGDANADSRVDLADAIFLFGYLFGTQAVELGCEDAADSDDNGQLELTDGIFNLGFVFLGRREPPAPGPFRCGTDPTRDGLACERFPPCKSDFEEGKWITRNADGSVHGVIETRRNQALFSVPNGDVVAAFRGWIRDHAEELGLDSKPGQPIRLDELVPAPRPTSTAGSLIVFHFIQTYRGIEIVGPERTVSLTTLVDPTTPNGFRALSFAGTILDRREVYRGLNEKHLSQQMALRAVRDAWLAAETGEGEPHPSPNDTIGGISLVALPQRRTLAFRGEILDGTKNLAHVYVDAVDGHGIGHEVLVVSDAFNHREVGVSAYEISNDPGTTERFFTRGHRGSTLNLGDHCPRPWEGGCLVQMGDDRLSIWNFENDPSSPPVTNWAFEYYPPGDPFTTPPYWAAFIAHPDDFPFRFVTQNLFQKADLAIAAGDAVKATFGWDHHPEAPFQIFTPAPVSIFVNLPSSTCGGAVGSAHTQTFGAEWDAEHHPYAGTSYPLAVVQVCNQQVDTLFHELGHYYDLYSDYGVLGTGLVTDSCVWDTPDEAKALAETIADSISLYFFRKLYPGLGYRLTATDESCSMSAVGRSILVHHSSCWDEAAQFDDDRPSAHASDPCNKSAGYGMPSVYQALWKYLHGKDCDASGNCSNLAVQPSVDSLMESMFYALSLGNLQSYKQFFGHMATYLGVHHGAETEDFFRSTLSLHGLLD